ncbi:MAG: cbb3-type cytochrome c oxidase N-terminal domain-containing protein [Bacteroidia bacterium]
MNTPIAKKRNWLIALLGAPLLTFSQEAVRSTPTVFSNALFNTLLGIIVFLLIVIVALNRVLKNLAQSDYLAKQKENENNNGNPLKVVSILFFTFLTMSLSAQEAPDHKLTGSWLVGGLDMFTFYFMIGVIGLQIIVIILLLYTLQFLLRPAKQKVVVKEAKKEKSILEKLNASVEIEKEEEILMDHDYDGIRELDNDLPPWWRYGFYLTILVAVVYLIHYHVTLTGDLQLAEYDKEVAKGKMEVDEFMKKSAANVDETTVKMLAGADIESGKSLFVSTCATCHGKLGEGGVGPNLTDGYWLHGGSLADVFKTVKYGWPDKGMKSWKEDLSPIQIAQISSFIKTLNGTNPPNAKAQQGDLYIEAGVASDTTRAVKDSLQIKMMPDSGTVTTELKK